MPSPQEQPGTDDRAQARASGLEPSSLRHLWEEHRRWVAAIVLAYKPRWAELDDLLQDVATAFVSRSHEIRDPQAVKPWLRTVAINAARLAARKGKLRLHRSLDEPTPQGQAPDEPTAPSESAAGPGQEELARLIDLTSQLPDGYREPLLLKAVQGLSYRQIGQILEMPETTVETRIARGRRMLRELAQGQTLSPQG